MASEQLERVFKFNNQNLSDPDPTLSPQQVMEIYANQYPELVNSNISGPKIDGKKAVYEFSKQIGRKG